MEKYTYKIIRQLLNEQSFITVGELADRVHVAKRSIQDMLGEVDLYLHQHDFQPTERVPNRGIRIKEAEKHDIEHVLEKFSDTYRVLTFSLAEDRQLFLLFLLINSHQKINIEPLASLMDVSIRTISNDITFIRNDLAKHGLSLQFDKRTGYYIEGNIFIARNMFITRMKAEFDLHSVKQQISILQRLYQLHHEDLYLTDINAVHHLHDLLVSIIPKPYEDAVIYTLLFYLLLAALQPKTQLGFELTKQDKAYLEQSYSFTFAQIIRMKVTELLQVAMCEEEDYFLSILLHSYPGNEKNSFEQNYPFEVEVLAQKIMKIVGEEQSYPFEMDTELYYIIVNHLRPLIYRLMFNCQLSNPLIELVKRKYASIHAATKHALHEVEIFTSMQISEDECSYFTLYFASSIEKIMEMQQDEIKAIIVCNAGNAVSRLLQYQLMNRFHIQIVDVTAEKELYRRLAADPVDLIVTVVAIDESKLNGIPCIHVNAFLQESDYAKLHVYLHQQYGDSIALQPIQKQAGLLELLKNTSFQIVDRVSSMDELIRNAGQLLYEQGYCDEEYGELMINVAHSFGVITHIMIAPGIILPHAGISEHVYQPGISFVRTRCPIESYDKKIHCAFALCTTDKQIHRLAIQQLGLLLNHKMFLSEIIKIESYEKFTALIQQCL